MDFVEKVQVFLMEPSKAFDAAKGENLNEAIKYYVVIAAIYSALSAVVFVLMSSTIGRMMGGLNPGMLMGGGMVTGGAAVLFVSSLILWIVSAFIGGAILHIFVYIVGGRNGIEQTVKAVMYGSTPGLLLGWIPFIGVIAWIWSVVVEILGIRQLHEITTGKAVLAVVLLFVVAGILSIIFAAVIAAFIFGMVPSGGGY